MNNDNSHRLVAKVNQVTKLFDTFGLEVPKETYERYAKLLDGINTQRENYDEIIQGIFPERSLGIVVEKDIPIFSYCEHHILPWFGQVHIGYVTQGRVLGISKFTRVVNFYSSGLTIQERVTNDIAEFFLKNRWSSVMVMVEAIHTCKVARGVQNPFSRSITIEARGVFKTDTGPRLEFFDSINTAKRST